jgi:formate dehydrogenase major subunit
MRKTTGVIVVSDAGKRLNIYQGVCRMEDISEKAYVVPNPLTPNAAVVINQETCIGCKRCVQVCRTDVLLPMENNKPPCAFACPADIDIKSQLTLIAKGKYKEALMLIKEAIPLPIVCSRVCPRFCERKCGRSGLEGPVAINMTKRFVADMDLAQGGPSIPSVKPATGHRAAVVGSGPAGLSAAYFLALDGHQVTMFEAGPKLGGLLRYGVPEFRLPKNLLDKEIESIAGICHEVRTGAALGKDFDLDSLKAEGFEAIVLAIGAESPLKLVVEGEDLKGVFHGVSFLRELNSGKVPEVGRKVVVIGGGMVAVDSAQCAMRLGAEEVTIVALEEKDLMPAYKEDVALAEEEGIGIVSSWGVKRILGATKLEGVELKSCLSIYDDEGRFMPRYDETCTQILKADSVIVAIGQTTDLSFLQIGTKANMVIETDDESATTLTGVYAAGDVVTGSKTVIEACAAGRRAAESINRYFKGQQVTPVEKPPMYSGDDMEWAERQAYADVDCARTVMPALKAEERKRSFEEIELGISESEVRKEAGRCFGCGNQPLAIYPDECWFCGCCVEHCPVPGAISMEFPVNQRVGWKRKDTGEYFRIGMKNPPPPNTKPPIG